MAEPLTRIRALIALALSASEHEARNAALLAVQLIRRHHIELVLPAEGRGTSFPSPADIALHNAIQKQAAKHSGTKKKPTVPEGWRKIKSKYNGSCKWCGKKITKDASIYWSKENGAYHPTCFALSDETK